jgi:dihydroorotase-like cyclic amidohydrolase
LIDPHVHLRDPEETAKEDFLTGTSAALAGGFTTVLDMPNNKSPITSLKKLDEKIAIAKTKTVSDIGFYFGSLGDNLDEFETASEKTKGLKIFLNHTTGDFLLNPTMLERIFATWPKTSPILFHAENETFDLVLKVLEGSIRPIHLCHVSTAHELRTVMEAKEKGLPVTCGVTPHHLFMTRDDETRLGPLGKMKPPLQRREDVSFLWEHLTMIDVIESDHAPHLLSEKRSGKEFFGVPNLETTLPLLLTAAHEGKITETDIIRLCHTNPSTIFKVQVDAETKTIVSTDEEWIVENESLLTKCKWSPYVGWRMKGRVKEVFLRGICVFRDGIILSAPGSGHIM